MQASSSARDGQDTDALVKFREYRRSRDRRVRNELVEAHRWLARVAARRLTHRGEPTEDLLQVAMLGLVKAVERFDPAYGRSFPAFALPTISGELRRHFRDGTWSMHVPRRTKELHLELASAVERLSHELKRPPRLDEVAAALDVSVDEVLEAIDAGNAYRPASLVQSARDEDSSDQVRTLAVEDAGLASADTRVALRRLLADLPSRERTILYLRFFADLTQTQIAERVGMSQVHVSRLLQATLQSLSAQLQSRPGDAAPWPGTTRGSALQGAGRRQ